MPVVDTSVAVMLRAVTCTCGYVFGLAETHQQELINTHGEFFCPKCKNSLAYKAENEAERLAKKAARLQAELDQKCAAMRDVYAAKDRVERRLSATQGIVTRVKNRVNRGVCPCCNRYFAQLHRHMNSKHPAYKGT